MQGRRDVGRRAEELAAQYLRRRGYRIHETNFRCAYGELDIVASEGNTLVFVEVRSRQGGVTDIEELVPARKQRKVHLVATAYLQERYGTLDGQENRHRRGVIPIPVRKDGDQPACRIDVVVIALSAEGTADRIELIRDAVQG